MLKKLLFLVFLTGALLTSGSMALAASPLQQRIDQLVIINGQQVQAATVVTNGAVQSYICANPQQYVAADQSSSGWACYDEATGTWLLHAQPQQSSGVYDQPQAYYPDTSEAYGYYPYPYPYGYYPYPYYGYYGPSFALGFGFGGHGFHDDHFHGDHGHAFVGHGPVGHGSFGNGSFGHGGGGGHMGGGAHFGGGGGHFGGGGGHMGGGGGRR